jgi:hypothetical protein
LGQKCRWKIAELGSTPTGNAPNSKLHNAGERAALTQARVRGALSGCRRPGNPQFPFPRLKFPILPGIGEGIPDSRFDWESGKHGIPDSRFGRESPGIGDAPLCEYIMHDPGLDVALGPRNVDSGLLPTLRPADGGWRLGRGDGGLWDGLFGLGRCRPKRCRESIEPKLQKSSSRAALIARN